ncbi:MAG: MotA/TolQ/ExbB proton channel family protein [Thermodesulfobacteriota bacterium]|nr:MotA/TolQ/ExbB proton channel family protein [Thermodesulfobacteriota bacterium]
MAGIDFLEMFRQSTFVIKVVLVILLLMSVASWSVIFFKLLQLSRVRKKVGADLDVFQRAYDLKAAVKLLGRDSDSPARRMAVEGVHEFNRLREIGRSPAEEARMVLDGVRHALGREAGTQAEKMSEALPFLATCGNVAPLLGLFGTVWGIMHSFHGFSGLKTQALTAVAPGLAEALVTTALGLVVAIPAVSAYNFFLGTIRRIERDLAGFTGAFLNQVKKEFSGFQAGDRVRD